MLTRPDIEPPSPGAVEKARTLLERALDPSKVMTEEMAAAVLERIGAECEGRWPGCRVAIHHRVGVLRPGDLAVVIAVAAPHRAEAFSGCRHAIERLKEDVPIWKREVGPDGSEWVGMGP